VRPSLTLIVVTTAPLHGHVDAAAAAAGKADAVESHHTRPSFTVHRSPRSSSLTDCDNLLAPACTGGGTYCFDRPARLFVNGIARKLMGGFSRTFENELGKNSLYFLNFKFL